MQQYHSSYENVGKEKKNTLMRTTRDMVQKESREGGLFGFDTKLSENTL